MGKDADDPKQFEERVKTVLAKTLRELVDSEIGRWLKIVAAIFGVLGAVFVSDVKVFKTNLIRGLVSSMFPVDESQVRAIVWSELQHQVATSFSQRIEFDPEGTQDAAVPFFSSTESVVIFCWKVMQKEAGQTMVFHLDDDPGREYRPKTLESCEELQRAFSVSTAGTGDVRRMHILQASLEQSNSLKPSRGRFRADVVVNVVGRLRDSQ